MAKRGKSKAWAKIQALRKKAKQAPSEEAGGNPFDFLGQAPGAKFLPKPMRGKFPKSAVKGSKKAAAARKRGRV